MVGPRRSVSVTSPCAVVLRSQVGVGQRRGAMGEKLAEMKTLQARIYRLEEDKPILKSATVFFAGKLEPRNR